MFKNRLFWVMTALVLGAMVGTWLPSIGSQLEILSVIFLRLLKTISMPLLFLMVVSGIAGHGSLKELGGMAWKAFVFFEVVTTVAMFSGYLIAHVLELGKGLDLSGLDKSRLNTPSVNAGSVPQMSDWRDTLINSFPDNLIKAFLEMNLLQVLVLGLLISVGLMLVQQEQKDILLKPLQALLEVFLKILHLLMYYAPIAVFGAFAFTIAQKGILIVSSIAWYVATVYVLLFLFTLIVFGIIGYLFKIKIKPLFKELAETLTLVYATAQGRACLAYAMAGLEKLGVPKKYYSFVLGVGFQFNLTGMAFFVGLTAVFAINANGLQLTFWQQLPLLMTLRLATIGGVNIGSLPLLLIILPQFNIAQSPIILLFGVDILMDMARSVVNMAGNCLASVAIAKWDNPKENAHL